jgi:hypothetical protein
MGGIAQLARASALHAEGRGFESLYLHICRSGGKNVATFKTSRSTSKGVYPKWTSCEYPTSPPAPLFGPIAQLVRAARS